jgi:hypothetical protein
MHGGDAVVTPAGARRADGSRMLRRIFAREVARLPLAADGSPGPAVTEADVAGLPDAARRYVDFMRVVGRPRDTTFRAHLRGRFRPRRDGGWIAAEMRQFTSAPDVARIFHMTLRMAGLPVYGRDTYLLGRGRMLVRPLDLFTVEDLEGPDFDVGELVTYLNDAVLLAPSMLFAPGVRFQAVGAGSFDLVLTHRDTTVRARVLVGADGAPFDFSTEDRYFATTRARTRWTTPVGGWQEVDGRRLPTSGRAVWHFAEGEFCYAELAFRPGDVEYGVGPR